MCLFGEGRGFVNIVISGLTAAGKTTHAANLAARLGYELCSAGTLLAGLAGMGDVPYQDLWVDHGQQLDQLRRQTSLDARLDEILLSRAAADERTVFDSWALPWTSGEPMLRIWLESSLHSRTLKCIVSHLPGRRLSYAEAERLVAEKDAASRAQLLGLHGFDVKRSRKPFHVIVDLSSLIADATAEASYRSVELGQLLIDSLCLGALRGEALDSTARSLDSSLRSLILRLRQP